MNAFKATLVFAVVLLLFTGCKKEEEPKVITNGRGFIQFKLDGKQYRIDDIGTGSLTFIKDSSIKLNAIDVIISSVRLNVGAVAFIGVNSPQEIQEKYAYNSAELDGYGPTFSFRPDFSEEKYFIANISTNSTGNVEYTQIVGNKQVAGKFSFKNVKYYDYESDKELSENHTITDGSFSLDVSK